MLPPPRTPLPPPPPLAEVLDSIIAGEGNRGVPNETAHPQTIVLQQTCLQKLEELSAVFQCMTYRQRWSDKKEGPTAGLWEGEEIGAFDRNSTGVGVTGESVGMPVGVPVGDATGLAEGPLVA